MNRTASLNAYVAAGAITAGDVAAATMLVELARTHGAGDPEQLAWVAMCLALRTPRDGHTCVDLDRIADWAGDIDLAASASLPWPGDAASWRRALETAPALVGSSHERRPFILDGNRLYLARSLDEERGIATLLIQDNAARVSVLLGGPGTGKTTQVARQLIERFSMADRPQIALAAPTGKAAARMTEALKNRCAAAKAPQQVFDAIDAAPAITIHKLLGYGPHRTPRFKFGPDNPLTYDLVVVDEASMLSSSLMYRLLAALSKDTHLLLVGDPDQLASVDAGSVLADIASSAARPGSALHSRTTTWMERHRFGADIGKLADAILAGSPAETLAVLTAGLDAVTWIEPGQDRVAAVAAEVGAHASHLRNLAAGGDAAAVLEAQKRLQVLCAHRDGPTGVSGWNARIEKGLGMLAGDSWYPGRPVMVTRNNRALKLFNGDAGIVIPAAGDRMEAVFGQPGSMLRVPVTRLEDVATMHAITIHKSQGSEYGHAIVVLPEARSRLLTRELLYTGVTRAVDKVTVIGSREVIEAAVSHPIRRASGLASRL